MALDAFGRLRISENFTLFNYYPTPHTPNNNYDIDRWITVSTGNISVSYNSANYISMLVNLGIGYVIRQSKMPMEYQPGKSRLLYFTGVLLGLPILGATVKSAIGIMNTTNNTINEGIYFQTDGISLYWTENVQTTSSTATETSIIQTAWNIDTFDGTGPSGLTLTIANASLNMLLVIDQEWFIKINKFRYNV